jgi:hypothetical protein
MANLNGKIGQVPGGKAVVLIEAYTLFTRMIEALKRDKGVELQVLQGYMSKFEVVDELRKIAKNKDKEGYASLLDPKAKIEDILGVKPATTAPTGSATPTTGSAASGSAATGSAAPVPTVPAFPEGSYDKLETYLKGLGTDEYEPPIPTPFQSSQESFPVLPYPNKPGLDPRQTANLFVLGPSESIKPDILNWISNNSILYGFLPYGNPQIAAVYYVGVDKLKNKVKAEESVIKVVSIFLQQQLSPDIVTKTVDEVLKHNLNGGAEFMDPGNLDEVLDPNKQIQDNDKQAIPCVVIPGEDDKVVRYDVAVAYVAMKAAAAKDGVTLAIGSAFRPAFGDVPSIVTKSGRKVALTSQYYLRKTRAPGKGESHWLNAPSSAYNVAVAPPGKSQHGNGRALDLNTGGYESYPAAPFTAGGKVMKWLTENAHRFGFLRAVASEAWHWEYYPPNKPTKSGKSSKTGPYTLVAKSNSQWGPYNNVDWESKGGFAGSAS